MELHRRKFLALSALAPTAALLPAQTRKTEAFGFFLVGDTHFLADKASPSKLDAKSAKVTRGLVTMLNTLPGTTIPKDAGGGTVLSPQGVIHAGDCIDTGDKADTKMQETEWAAFRDEYGLKAGDGRLKHAVYEIHGNHDGPRGESIVVKGIIQRNKTRPGLKSVSKNGLHYSWDWGGVHFVNLGIVVGRPDEPVRRRRYDPHDSLAFLLSDLKEQVGTTGRPVVLTHHVDMIRYAQPLPVEDAKAGSMEWDPADVKSYYDAIKAYNIAAIFYGHTHARSVYRWDGSPKRSEQGIPTFNVDNSSHFGSLAQAFFYFEIGESGLTCREYQTKDGWETGEWTPQTWTVPVRWAAAKS